MEKTYLVVGLGNPGIKYEASYHNIGWLAVDALAEAYQIKLNRSKFNGLYGQGRIDRHKLILLKPTTFMNNSGEAVAAFARFFKLPAEQIAVIYDDIDLPTGSMRIREKGGPGTHNGMKSVVQLLGSRNFPRFRIGIGPLPEHIDIISYVLARITEADLALIAPLFKDLKQALDIWMDKDIQFAMNRLNRRVNGAKKRDRGGPKQGQPSQPADRSGGGLRSAAADITNGDMEAVELEAQNIVPASGGESVGGRP